MVNCCSAEAVMSKSEEEPVEGKNGTDTEITVIDENSIQKPTWKIGDNWCMGYTFDFSDMEDEMRSDFDSAMGKINRLVVRGEIGMFQSAEVVKDDVVVKIDGTDYICYKVYFEQYMGGAFTMDYDIEIEIPDYSYYEEEDYYGEFRSKSGSSYPTTNAKMKSYTYMKLKSDVVGYIYYTVDNLAVAKGSFNQQLDGEIEMDLDARMNGQTYMDMATTFKFLNVRSDYDVEYNPPLDIFNFPIEPNEYWSANSMMTTTLNKISGRIIYDITSTGTEYPSTAMKDDIDLDQEISTPDSYGPVRVTHYFYNPGTKAVNLLDGIKSECIIIEPDEDYWYHDYDEYEDYSWSDTDSDGIANLEEYSSDVSSPSSSMIPYGGIGADDFTAESLESPIETSANSINYYSEDKGNIISYEPSDESSSSFTSVPYISSDGENVAEPKTYLQVTTFKTEDRENYITKYSRSSGGGGVKDDSTWTLIIASITIAFLVFIVIIAAIKISKKKRVQQMTPNYSLPSQTRGSEQQYPYSQTPSYPRPTQNQPSYQPQNQPSYQPQNQPSYQPQNQPSYQPSPQQMQDYVSYETYGSQPQYPTRTDHHPATPTMPQHPYDRQSAYQSPNYPDYNEPYDPRPRYDYNPSEYNYDPYNKN